MSRNFDWQGGNDGTKWFRTRMQLAGWADPAVKELISKVLLILDFPSSSRDKLESYLLAIDSIDGLGVESSFLEFIKTVLLAFDLPPNLIDLIDKLKSHLLAIEAIGELGSEGNPESAGNNLRNIFILKKIQQASSSVCQLNIGPSTGFLIKDDVLVTCNHVLPDQNIAKMCRVRFNFELEENGMPSSPDEYRLDSSFFYTDPELDITIVKFAKSPDESYVRLPVKRISAKEGNSAIVIQHPKIYGYKQIALGDTEIKKVLPKELHYLSDTLPGSSGSPIINDDSELIGIHCETHHKTGPSDYFRNLGTPITDVIDFLERKGLEHLVTY